MARRRSISPQSLLVFACGVLMLTALVPSRLTGWGRALRGPATVIVAPIQRPMAMLESWLREPMSKRIRAETPEFRDLREQRDLLLTENQLLMQENEELHGVIRALQEGVGRGDRQRFRILEAKRIGSDPRAGTIDVARGSMDGVTINTVATAVTATHHLLGVVSSVSTKVSSIHLLTDERLTPGLMEAIIIPERITDLESIEDAPRIQLRPVGDGTLIADIGRDDAERVKPGDLAYLDDPHWPAAAQRLIIGRVRAMREEPDRPLFRTVIIEPDMDPSRVRAVILRTPSDEVGAAGALTQESGGG